MTIYDNYRFSDFLAKCKYASQHFEKLNLLETTSDLTRVSKFLY
jgi:hypothetical protein